MIQVYAPPLVVRALNIDRHHAPLHGQPVKSVNGVMLTHSICGEGYNNPHGCRYALCSAFRGNECPVKKGFLARRLRVRIPLGAAAVAANCKSQELKELVIVPVWRMRAIPVR